MNTDLLPGVSKYILLLIEFSLGKQVTEYFLFCSMPFIE